MKFLILLSVTFSITCKYVVAQQDYYPFETTYYPFIDNSKNAFIFPSDSDAFRRFYLKFSNLIKFGEEQVRIVHIGGSHIQADAYTHRMRQRFNMLMPGITGPRGFIFPYTIAQTNNPMNFGVRYTGNWGMCKNTLRDETCMLGLSGYSVSTSDTTASITVFLNRDSAMRFEYNRLKLFHQNAARDYKVLIMPEEQCKMQLRNERLGYTEYYFDEYLDSVTLLLKKTDTLQNTFGLYGMSFESDDPGIVYHAVGVNGARLESFLRCQLLEQHLMALKPDMVVISIGTNDGYTRRFDPEGYKNRYAALIDRIGNALPEAAILLTVPNDSYMYRRFVNRNTEKMQQVIMGLAEKNSTGVWDFYSLMGGLNSVQDWYNAGLMNGDHVHFSKQGYKFKGDLFFTAFLNTWEKFLEEGD
ncbi:MAG: GDSL-type esterase/lipase family protein [Bacteroidales bacterium]